MPLIVCVDNVYDSDIFRVPEKFALFQDAQKCAKNQHMVLSPRISDTFVPDLSSDTMLRFWIGASADIHVNNSLAMLRVMGYDIPLSRALVQFTSPTWSRRPLCRATVRACAGFVSLA